jgi:hypothetical protein
LTVRPITASSIVSVTLFSAISSHAGTLKCRASIATDAESDACQDAVTSIEWTGEWAKSMWPDNRPARIHALLAVLDVQ